VDIKPDIDLVLNPSVPILGTPTLISSKFIWDSQKAYNNYITVYEDQTVWKNGATIVSYSTNISVNPSGSTTYICEKIYTLNYSPDASNSQTVTGCKVSKSITVSPNIPPFANAGPDLSIPCFGGSVQINGSASGTAPPFSYLWSPSTGLSTTNIPNPIASPAVTTTYRLTVTDSKGLKGTDDVVITVPPQDATPTITGNDVVYAPCPYPNVSSYYRFDVQSIPPNATSFTWETTLGYISRYFYTGGRVTGIEVAIGGPPPIYARPAAITPTPIFSGTVTCTANYPCGGKKTVKNVDVAVPQCVQPRDPYPTTLPPGGGIPGSGIEMLQALGNENVEEISIYPNPASKGQFEILFFVLDKPNNVTIKIIDSSGKVYHESDLGVINPGYYSKKAEIDQQGSYIVVLKNGDKTKKQRLIVMK
jgi:hypothetical protein